MQPVDLSQSTFAQALRKERRRVELTQTQLAKRVNTSQQNVAAWEAGRSLPRPELFDALVEVFGKHTRLAALPPRGVIPGGTEILEANEAIYAADLSARNAVPAQSTFAHAVGLVFDDLPADPLLRAKVFSQVTTVIINAGIAHGQPTTPEPVLNPVKQRA